MTSVTFRTAKGSEIVIRIVTERPNMADSSMMQKCWDITVHANNQALFGAHLVNDTKHGLCIRSGNNVVPVPVEAASDVQAIFDLYRTERDRRHAAAVAEDEAYWANRRNFERNLGAGETHR